jgi:hypothetical protein
LKNTLKAIAVNLLGLRKVIFWKISYIPAAQKEYGAAKNEQSPANSCQLCARAVSQQTWKKKS